MASDYVTIDDVVYVRQNLAKQKVLKAVSEERERRNGLDSTPCKVLAVIPHQTVCGNFLRLELGADSFGKPAMPSVLNGLRLKPNDLISVSVVRRG